jgi:hypothetical protein
MMHIAPVDFVSVMTQADPASRAKCECPTLRLAGAFSCPRHTPNAYARGAAKHRGDKP